MTTELRIPALGAGMTEGTIVEWHAADGAAVKAGDLVYTLESEKTCQEVEAPAAGALKTLGDAGKTYAVGELIGIIQ